MPEQREGDADVPLSDLGERQLRFECTAQRRDFMDRPVQMVLCSPLQRALQTALVAYPEQRIVLDVRLREVDATSGMLRDEVKSFVRRKCPRRQEDVDVSRVPEEPWWGNENPKAVRERLQSLVREVKDFCLEGGVVAFVGHSLAMQYLVGYPLKPFPAAWGSPRGWPRNFKPYFASIRCSPGSSHISVVETPKESATLVLVRHAHSKAQADRTLEKKRSREEAILDTEYEPAPQKRKFKIMRGSSRVPDLSARVATETEPEAEPHTIAETRRAEALALPAESEHSVCAGVSKEETSKAPVLLNDADYQNHLRNVQMIVEKVTNKCKRRTDADQWFNMLRRNIGKPIPKGHTLRIEDVEESWKQICKILI